MKLDGKWVLLTGATGGIGEAIVPALYAKGANLLLVGRDAQRLARLLIINRLSPSRVITIEADLNQHAGQSKIVAACAALPEPLSILVNNAGISDFSFLDEQDEQAIINLFKTNLLAPVLLTRLLLPLLKKSPHALIVNIGSTFGSIGYPGFAAYSASKFGFRGFSEAIRRELADTTVRVCYVAPRATKTSINTDQVNQMNATLGNAMDEPAVVAAAVTQTIEKEKLAIYIGWPEKIFVKVNQLLPGIVDGALRKQLPVISRFAQLRKKP